MPRTSRVHDPRTCERCGGDLPAGSSVNRRFCPRCGHVRRAITYLRTAAGELDLGGEHTIEAVVSGAIGALEP